MPDLSWKIFLMQFLIFNYHPKKMIDTEILSFLIYTYSLWNYVSNNYLIIL